MKNIIVRIATFLVVSVSQAAHATPSLILNSWGAITGINDVVVLGQDYDVFFSPSSCTSALNNCDQDSFTFHTESQAASANASLINQVFNSLNIVATKWDYIFSAEAGCYNPHGGHSCPWEQFSGIFTPYQTNFERQSVYSVETAFFLYGDNYGPTGYDIYGPSANQEPFLFDVGSTLQSYYAVWKLNPDVQVVSSPCVIELLAIAFLGMAIARKNGIKLA